MFGIYEQAIRLAIADRLQSEDKVLIQFMPLEYWTGQVLWFIRYSSLGSFDDMWL